MPVKFLPTTTPVTASSPDDVAAFRALRSARTPKVEWLDDAGHACPRSVAAWVRLTKYAGRGLKAVRVDVTRDEAEAIMAGSLL